MIESKHVNLYVHNRREGEPYRLKLVHKPTDKSAEGEGVDIDAALADAQAKLEKIVAQELLELARLTDDPRTPAALAGFITQEIARAAAKVPR